MGFPQSHSLLWAPICSGVGSSKGCRWICASPCTSKGCGGISAPPCHLQGLQGDLCSSMHLQGRQGNNLCSGTWSTFSPSSPLTLVSEKLFPSHIFTPLCGFSCAATLSPSYRHYHSSAASIADGLGLGQQWVPLGAGWHWFCWTWGKHLVASHRSHTCSPFHYQNFDVQTQYTEI